MRFKLDENLDARFASIVLRPHRNTLALIRETLVSMVPMLSRERLDGVLWIVEPGRIRINRPWDEEEEC